jgi:hypothetical protein
MSDDYCSGDCFRCDQADDCVDHDGTTEGDYDDYNGPPFAGDLPACPRCGDLDCEGECVLVELPDDEADEHDFDDVPF